MTYLSDNLLHHKGYTGTAEMSVADGCMHGQLLHIDDLITYSGQTVPELVAEFKAAVEDYLAYCKEVGKTPDKPYTGSFNVRVGADRHRWLVETARAQGGSLNDVMCQAVDALRTQRQAAAAAPAPSRQAAMEQLVFVTHRLPEDVAGVQTFDVEDAFASRSHYAASSAAEPETGDWSMTTIGQIQSVANMVMADPVVDNAVAPRVILPAYRLN